MFTINATIRKYQGESASRRLRSSNKLPAIIYGGKNESILIEIEQSQIWNMQNQPEFYSEVLTIVIEQKEEKVKVQAIQRHVFKPKIIHIDFIRI